MTRKSRRKSGWSAHLLVAALFLLLSLWVTFPLCLDPANTIQGLSDPLLNAYIIDWNHYALLHQLGDFFQANVFWPHADALAYGEHLLAPALLILPARLFTTSAVALHNLSVIQGYWFSALAAYALAWFYFRRFGPALLAGLLYGFAPYRIQQSGHVQLLHGEFLPLAILAFEKTLRARDGMDRRRWQALLCLSVAGQALTSWYWAVFSAFTIGPYIVLRLWQRRKRVNRSLIAAIAIPLCAAVLLVVPMAVPYLRLKARNILIRAPMPDQSARPTDFFVPADRHPFGGHRKSVTSERTLYPGVAVLVLVPCALGFWFRKKKVSRFPSGIWLGIVAALLIFGFGSVLRIGDEGFGIPLPYAIVEHLPFVGGIRVPARWILPALLGLAMLAAHFAMRMSDGKIGRHLVKGALAVALLETTATQQLKLVSIERPDSTFAWLRSQPFPTPVIELPLKDDTDNTPMLHATWHRQPTVNGTNGFFPPGYKRDMEIISRFPAPEALELLRAWNIRYVLVNNDPRTAPLRTSIAASIFGRHTGANGSGMWTAYDLTVYGKPFN